MAPKKRILTTVPTVEETVAPPVQLTNHFKFVLDRSSSMSPIAPNAIKAFNENIEAVRQAAKQYGQQTTAGLITFGSDVKVEWDNQPIERVRNLDEYTYRPGGMTALFDAVGTAIGLCERSPDAQNPNASFIILVTTDGEENQSRRFKEGGEACGRYGLPSIVDVMNRVQKTDRYTIAFLVPPNAGKAFAQRYGIPLGNVREWEATSRGMAEAAQATARGTQDFYQARTKGVRSSRTYYTTDLSQVTKTDLSKMTDLSMNFRKFTVDKEEEIQPFIERHGIQFVLGAGFYALTKKEKLRAGRNVMVRDKATKRIYGGAQARQILGLPAGECWVQPGNHSNFDVFFQSTSRNRKLVRGTELLLDKTKITDDAETWDSAGAKAAADLKKAQQAGFTPPGAPLKA
jgi:hypothetical protein